MWIQGQKIWIILRFVVGAFKVTFWIFYYHDNFLHFPVGTCYASRHGIVESFCCFVKWQIKIDCLLGSNRKTRQKLDFKNAGNILMLATVWQTFEYETHCKRKSWKLLLKNREITSNKLQWINFWRVLAIWYHCGQAWQCLLKVFVVL